MIVFPFLRYAAKAQIGLTLPSVLVLPYREKGSRIYRKVISEGLQMMQVNFVGHLPLIWRPVRCLENWPFLEHEVQL